MLSQLDWLETVSTDLDKSSFVDDRSGDLTSSSSHTDWSLDTVVLDLYISLSMSTRLTDPVSTISGSWVFSWVFLIAMEILIIPPLWKVPFNWDIACLACSSISNWTIADFFDVLLILVIKPNGQNKILSVFLVAALPNPLM